MSHFPTAYVGNKYKEFKDYYELIEIKDNNVIIEPFSGSCAMSFFLYQKNKDKNLNFILNDLSKLTYGIYEMLKNKTIEEIESELTKTAKYLSIKENWKKHVKEGLNENFLYHMIYNKFYNFRPYVYPEVKKVSWEFKFTKLQLEFIEFIKSDRVQISNKDWYEVFMENKDNENAIFLFDPPYLNSDNQYYDTARDKPLNKNVYEYFSSEYTHKSNIYFMLEDNWIVRLLFKNCEILKTVDKTYQLTKKKTTHLLIKC